MLNVGFSEILLFGIIALIVLGPEKLPIAARTAGRWYAHVRRLISNVQRDIEQELQLAEMREHMQQELARIKSIEKEMQNQLDQMHENLADLNQTIHPDHASTHGVSMPDPLSADTSRQPALFKPVEEQYRALLLQPIPAITSPLLIKEAVSLHKNMEADISTDFTNANTTSETDTTLEIKQ